MQRFSLTVILLVLLLGLHLAPRPAVATTYQGFTTTVNAEQIAAGNYYNFAELLRSLLGFDLLHTGARSSPSLISFQGLGSDQVTIIVDGIEINSDRDGFINLNMIPMINLEQVAVHTHFLPVGSGSARHGITIEVTTKVHTEKHSTLITNYGWQRFHKHNFQVYMGFLDEDDSINLTYEDSFVAWDRVWRERNYSHHYFLLNFRRVFDEKSYFIYQGKSWREHYTYNTYRYNQTDQNSGITTVVTEVEEPYDLDRYNNLYAGYSSHNLFGLHFDLEEWGGIDLRYIDTKKEGYPDPNAHSNEQRTESHINTFRYRSLLSNSNLDIGFEQKYSDFYSNNAYEDGTTSYSRYLRNQVVISDLVSFYLGYSHDNRDEFIGSAAEGNMLGLSITVSPSLEVAAYRTETQMLPTFEQMRSYDSTLGGYSYNTDIGKELGRSQGVTLTYRGSSIVWKGDFFSNNIDNRITQVAGAGQAPLYVNVGNVTSRGLSSMLTLGNHGSGLYGYWSLNRQDTLDEATGNKLPFIPQERHYFTLGLSNIFPGGDGGLRIELSSEQVKNRYADLQNTISMDPYQIYNLEGTLALGGLSFRAKANNLSNVEYEDFPGRTLPGANYYYGVFWEFIDK